MRALHSLIRAYDGSRAHMGDAQEGAVPNNRPGPMPINATGAPSAPRSLPHSPMNMAECSATGEVFTFCLPPAA